MNSIGVMRPARSLNPIAETARTPLGASGTRMKRIEQDTLPNWLVDVVDV
jgi:hypothetical protein